MYRFELSGGLGNQLFMLYAGLYFQEKFQKKVFFDITELKSLESLHPGMNVIDLGLLSHKMIYRKPKVFRNFPARDALNRIWAKLKHIFGYINPRVYKISEVGFFDFSNLPRRAVKIVGYFQSWKYYSYLNNKPNLKPDSIADPSDWYQEQKILLEEKKFAAFHVRRGDYKLSKNQKNGLLSTSYYSKVAREIPKEMEILVFTDSESEVYDELSFDGRGFKMITPPEDSDPAESLLLMSLASHIAIANSTYSWWAAMISQTDTVVYAPTKWFEFGDDPVDLLPDPWIRVPSEWMNQK